MVTIEMENGKKIKIELYPEIAPVTCENFEKLVKDGFYDGLTFHRIIPGFMIQGGCPLGNGTGNPGWSIKGEFSSNGFKNDLKHTKRRNFYGSFNDAEFSRFTVLYNAWKMLRTLTDNMRLSERLLRVWRLLTK